MLDIPYSGSDPLTLAATLDKDVAKRLVRSADLAAPRDFVIQPDDDLHGFRASLPFAAIVKPAWEGSSKGIRGQCVVDEPKQLIEVVERLRRDHRQPILVEEFIQGDELTVGILGNDPPRVVGVMRVLPRQATDRFVYSLEVKRDYERQVRYECPARLGLGQMKPIEKAALTAYRALGCRDVSRVDFRLRDGVPYFIELNPLPGLNPESSDLVILTRLAGWSYEKLIGSILDTALVRCGLQTAAAEPTTA
jgi:D-alanine-D-alanine ligase